MAQAKRRRSFWSANLLLLFLCSCTPREIEQEQVRVQEQEQEQLREMPKPGGSDQHRLDSIKRELNIKRQQQEEKR